MGHPKVGKRWEQLCQIYDSYEELRISLVDPMAFSTSARYDFVFDWTILWLGVNVTLRDSALRNNGQTRTHESRLVDLLDSYSLFPQFLLVQQYIYVYLMRCP